MENIVKNPANIRDSVFAPPGRPPMKKLHARLYGFGIVFCFVGMIIVTKDSVHKGSDLAYIRGITGIIYGSLYGRYYKESWYTREGNDMELFMLRGFLSALMFILQIYANKELNSSIYAVISRLKVFFVVIMTNLFGSEYVDMRALFLTIIAFMGVCLVMDPSIFGFPTSTDPNAIRIIGLERELIGVMVCVIYLIISSMTRSVIVYASRTLNDTQVYILLSFFNVVINSIPIMYDPIVWRYDEIDTYIKVTILGILTFHCFIKYLSYENDMSVFILIQTTIVVFTFAIDIFYYDKEFNIYNIAGGAMVVGSAILLFALK